MNHFSKIIFKNQEENFNIMNKISISWAKNLKKDEQLKKPRE
jgi:hypothetical protein